MNRSFPITATVVDGAHAHDYTALKPAQVPLWCATAGLAATLVATIHSAWIVPTLPDFAAWSCVLALVLACASALFIMPRAFCPGFLIALLPFLLAWRVAAMNGAAPVEWVASFASVPLLALFFDCMRSDIRRDAARPGAWLGTLVWQMTIVRLYFGLNELGHSSEKIFAGLASFHKLTAIFHSFGIGDAAPLFVIAGGLIELASAISVGLGLFARLGAFVSVVYFLVATVGYGHEWTRGYAWATAGGGGWEYVMMLLVVFGSVMFAGGGEILARRLAAAARAYP